MNYFEILSLKKVEKLAQKRKGETKLFEDVNFLNSKQSIEKQLENSSVKYVIFGIPEDLGVLANYGNAGTKNAWKEVIEVLLNIQSNKTTYADQILILGCFDFREIYMQITDFEDVKTLRKLVKIIDAQVTSLIYLIKKSGKIPIAIGGGHNNAYGMIKGCALALNSKINTINFDAHTDFRALEGRHSGNGFSYAMDEGFLERYYVFGLHEHYTSSSIYDRISKHEHIAFCTFESIQIRKEISFEKAINEGVNFVKNNFFGIEIDCDAITHCPSSAMTPTGFSSTKTRQFVHHFGKQKNASYLHICEAAPTKKESEIYSVGKLVVALILDFVRARNLV